MNFIHIAGHLGKDPETRFTGSGKKVTSFSVGVRCGKDETNWWKVNVWDERFDNLIPHLKKGGAVMVFGEVAKLKTFTGKEGEALVSAEINASSIQFSPFGKKEGEGERVVDFPPPTSIPF